MMLFLLWLAEQGVWVAPLITVVLYLAWPKRRNQPHRPLPLTVVVGAMATLFFTNLLGQYPSGPERVECRFGTGPTSCIFTTVGHQHADNRHRAGHAARFTGSPRAVSHSISTHRVQGVTAASLTLWNTVGVSTPSTNPRRARPQSPHTDAPAGAPRTRP